MHLMSLLCVYFHCLLSTASQKDCSECHFNPPSRTHTHRLVPPLELVLLEAPSGESWVRLMGVKTPIHTQTRTDTHTHTRTCAQYCVTHFKHVQEHQCTHTHTHTRVFTLRQCIVRPPTQSCSCANSTHTHVHTLWVHAESLCVSLHAHIGVCLFLYVCVCMCVYLCDCIYVLQAYVCKFECIMFLNICVSTCLVCQCVSVCV